MYKSQLKLYEISAVRVPSNLLRITNLSTVLFVDGNGNDSTAVKGLILKPYKTITAAKNAASPGDYIKVFPGTYTISSGLAKDGVIYDFEEATINYTGSGNMLGDTDLGTSVNYKIIGGTLNQNSTAGSLCVCAQANSRIEISDATLTDMRNQGQVGRGSFRMVNGAIATLRRCAITANTNVPILSDGSSTISCYDCTITGSNDVHTGCIEVRNNSLGRFFNCRVQANGSVPAVNLAPVNGGVNEIELNKCVVVNTSSGLAFNTVLPSQIIKVSGCIFVVNSSSYSIKFAAGTQDVDIFGNLFVNKGVDPAGGAINIKIGVYVEDINVTYII